MTHLIRENRKNSIMSRGKFIDRFTSAQRPAECSSLGNDVEEQPDIK